MTITAVYIFLNGPSAQADSTVKTLGFVVSNIYFGNDEGSVEQVCPAGMAETQREYALQSLSEADRDHLKSIGREATGADFTTCHRNTAIASIIRRATRLHPSIKRNATTGEPK
jgi:hypothetical protein